MSKKTKTIKENPLKEKLKSFIATNNNVNVNTTGDGSDANSVLCILSGYALHIGIKDSSVISETIDEVGHFPLNREEKNELARVFNYAQKKNYGKFWKTAAAKRQYNI